MIQVSNVSLNFGGQALFKNVNLLFQPGNCYGIIGANGAGKSTFLRILCGELEPSTGEIVIPPTVRMSVLKQDDIFEKIISIKYDVPNNRPELFDEYRDAVDRFYDGVVERNA